jgi:oligoendopeptidase F
VTPSSTLSIRAERNVEFPRKFTAGVLDFGQLEQLEPLFSKLAGSIGSLDSTPDLEDWLLQHSELQAAIDEESSRRYIAMTCATDDEACEKAYLDFVEKVDPHLKTWWDRLARLYLECPLRRDLDEDRYHVQDRSLENAVQLFREENVPLSTEEIRLSQQYQKINGAMTVNWRGEEKTLQQLSPMLEDLDRPVRKDAWNLVSSRRLEDRDTINDVFNRMLELRSRMAANAGFENYRDFMHRSKDRFDYTPEDCRTFHKAIEQEVVPLLQSRRKQRQEQMGLHGLRPWDLQVDPEGAAPLKPFKDAAGLEEGCLDIFGRISPSLAGIFGLMREKGLLDLDSRRGKAPGGYQCSLNEVRLPFIFMNSAGTNRDVFTLLHEGGHAFHCYAARKEPLVHYRHAPIEFCEVASMSMEMFALDLLEVFYKDPTDAARARVRHLDDLVTVFPWIATIDAFQHWIYLNPGHTDEQRTEKWVELETRYSPSIDWSGLDEVQSSLWHRQLHIFEVPFYYIEYGIAQLGALQLWMQFRKDPETTLQNYLNGLALGGSKALPKLFQASGIRFDFSVDVLGPVMEAVAAEIDRCADR